MPYDSKRKNGTCKLCGKHAQLCESHIVPEFCYKPIYCDKHRLVQARVSSHSISQIVRQKGCKEWMLCSQCETHLNTHYEQPFHKFWYENIITTESIESKYHMVSGFDYAIMKLFHLSVIWKCHYSQDFGRIDLGPYAYKIRAMLLDVDAGPENCLPVMGCLLLDDEWKIIDRIVSVPGVARFDQSHFYAMCYAGCEWLFVMTETPTRKQSKALSAFGIKQNGTMRLMTSHYKKTRSWDKLVREISLATKG